MPHDHLLAQLRTDLENLERSLEFWEKQPPAEMGDPITHFNDISVGQIQTLKAAINQTKSAIAIVESD